MSDEAIPRKTAFETVSEAFGLVLSYPMLLGGFTLVAAVEVTAPEGALGRPLLASLLGLFVGGVAHVYTESSLDGAMATFSEASERVTGRLLSLIGVFVVYVVVVGIGLLLLVAPGVYLGARLVLAFPACVLDDEPAFVSLETSWNVADGNVVKLVGIFLLLVVAAMGLILASRVPVDLGYTDPYLRLIGEVGASAILTATLEIATARVYLENRGSYVRNREPRQATIGGTRPVEPSRR